MQKLPPVFGALAAFLLACAPLGAQVRDLKEVEIKADIKTIAVRVSGTTPELDQLANLAFNAHGRYRRVSTGGAYDIRFSPAGATQVRVEVIRAGAPFATETASGSSLRQAFFRAADLAVERTSGLRGFFASNLAFIVERGGKMEVHTGDLFFGETRQITRDNAQALTPRWSPDGTRILYTSFFRTGFPDIFLINLATLQRTNFVAFKGTNSGARFSPNGQQVAMVLSGEGNSEVYVANAQGRQVARRTRTSAVEASPCFSPDGSQLVFTSDSAGGPQLYVMSAAGGAPRRLATNISGYCAEPDWSAGNPNLIAFTVRMGRGFQIAVHDLTGRTPTRAVSNVSGDAVEPSWLADGRHLVFTLRTPNARRLYILDTETGRSTPISAAGVMVSQASVHGP
jgi:TolB protein